MHYHPVGSLQSIYMLRICKKFVSVETFGCWVSVNRIFIGIVEFVRARLHQASESIWRQHCNDACDTALIDQKGVAPKLGATPFSSDSILTNENCVTSVIATLMQIDSEAWCKRALEWTQHNPFWGIYKTHSSNDNQSIRHY